ncbi:hypothetical protein V6N11_044272 [Hibiscus sabdariffa]|uniref:Uncharacterized protein n=1 Tax=Hibiscus sabdariffa TaxID=183260 RepID=A0ABR2RF46_9ROSI
MMLDRRHGVTGHQISSFNQPYRTHSNRDGTGDIEFDFWGERETWYYDDNNNNLDDGSEVEFRVEEACVGDSPSPLWGANKVTDDSPLLPNNHFYSNLSPTRRRQIIEQGRKELMEMVRNMPESSYELSLKDLVDQQNSSDTVKEKVVYEDKSFRMETERKKRKAKAKAGSLSRTASMEANHFLLKMFFPTCLSFKKKSTAENSSKVSPSPSCEGSEKLGCKEKFLARLLAILGFQEKMVANKQTVLDLEMKSSDF